MYTIQKIATVLALVGYVFALPHDGCQRRRHDGPPNSCILKRLPHDACNIAPFEKRHDGPPSSCVWDSSRKLMVKRQATGTSPSMPGMSGMPMDMPGMHHDDMGGMRHDTPAPKPGKQRRHGPTAPSPMPTSPATKQRRHGPTTPSPKPSPPATKQRRHGPDADDDIPGMVTAPSPAAKAPAPKPTTAGKSAKEKRHDACQQKRHDGPPNQC